MSNTVFIALGANLGSRDAAIGSALRELKSYALPQSWKESRLYETLPVGGSGPDYLNAVCSFTTDLSAPDLHRILIQLEQNAGRVRGALNAPRTLDLDLLFYGKEIISTPGLIVPHPRWFERTFVLVPLAEIAPEWVDPVSRKTVQQMLERFTPDMLQGVKIYDSHSFRAAVSS